MNIKLKKLHENAITPGKGTPQSACYDLYALEDTEFAPGEIKLVRTGWAAEPPPGWRINVYVRSSTPPKKGFILSNSVGIIDSDYRGELYVQLMNIKTGKFQLGNFTDGSVFPLFTNNKISRGEKIAQFELVPEPPESNLYIATELSTTQRGEGGCGSTGN